MKRIALGLLAAWVLWVEAVGGGVSYRIVETYETKAECKAGIGPQREARIQRHRMEPSNAGWSFKRLGETGVHFENKKEDLEFVLTYVCLPAGTSPRG